MLDGGVGAKDARDLVDAARRPDEAVGRNSEALRVGVPIYGADVDGDGVGRVVMVVDRTAGDEGGWDDGGIGSGGDEGGKV